MEHQMRMCFLCLLLLSSIWIHRIGGKSDRQKKQFGLFNIVSFPNDECTSSEGVCFSMTDCTNMGGSANGNCAAGFGVCCLFSTSTCGSTVNLNVSFIRNPDFPSATTMTQTCTFTFNRLGDDICQLRLDFNTLMTAEPGNGVCGGNSASTAGAGDEITVTSPSGFNPPGVGGLCGDNLSGQHMYVEFGSGNSITWSIVIGSDATIDRLWDIKASQIPCTADYKAPNGCVQYFTGVSGSISSYNRNGLRIVSGQNYQNCIRQEEGFCSIEYRNEFFTLINPPTPAVSQTPDAGTGAVCSLTAVIIPEAIGASAASFCGGVLSTGLSQTLNGVVRTEQSPFRVGVSFVDAADTTSQGFELKYNQIPC